MNLVLHEAAVRTLRQIARDVACGEFEVSQQLALAARRLIETIRAHGDPEQVDLILGKEFQTSKGGSDV